MTEKTNGTLIKALIFSIFGDDGPIPEVTLINEPDGVRSYQRDSLKELKGKLDFGALLQIAMKSISLLMGEHVYQDGEELEQVKYFGILPFPDLKMDGLTYFFLIPDEDARGSARASTLTILVSESNKNFFYDYMNELRIIITEHAYMLNKMMDFNGFSKISIALLKKLNGFIQQISYPISLKRNIKILFSGLDNSGKTSMILGLEKKYSKLINVRPTQGVARYQATILGMTISVWDLAGQIKYRNSYLKDAELYLFDCDLLFYLVDIRDEVRYQDAIDYLEKIFKAFRGFQESPPIIVCFHKMDPDSEPGLHEKVDSLKERIDAISEGFFIKYFNTTVFEPYTLITSFSYGIAKLSPNRDLFRLQLENLAKSAGARSVLLLNEQGMVISDYTNSDDPDIGQYFELSASHFTSLYNYFVNSIIKKNSSRALYYQDDCIVSFNVLENNKYKLFLMSLLDDENALEKITNSLDQFSERIMDLFNTFY
ncbi:MAG: ADP-ribosylation factor-like protein [Promethearchaeota archaeon]